MNFQQIENNLKEFIQNYTEDEFIYEFLKTYGLPKASITRLQQGSYNLSKDRNEVLWKKRVHYRKEREKDLHETITDLSKEILHDQRFVIVTDFETLLARDTQTKENLDIQINELPKHYAFFLPWAGMEKTEHQNENPADVKAAERMAKLFDEIKKDNPDDSPEFIHDLNVFLSRLLFCLFAEDTNIFPDGIFTNGIASHTNKDGSDMDTYLNTLFQVLNTPENQRDHLPAHFSDFPYVNGGLFEKDIQSPSFTARSRNRIIESGELDWSEINPDIFGSMMQAVITPEHRGGLGMHYTSVPNIMKVIKPLFLDELYEEFEKSEGNSKKLSELLHRIHNIKIFDPACGSGNFLIIAYKELRRLEMEVFKESGTMALSGITLDQFFGIELDDFAHEIAQLSLWLAEHQMNVEFFKEFGRANPTLPLKEAGKIVHGNACRLDWEKVCPRYKSDEVYILGNPPYLGTRNQKKNHKADMKFVFGKTKNYKSLDYIGAWYFKGANFIRSFNSKFAFVSTNSISQGDQVSILWPLILEQNLEIFFVHQTFKWVNSAKSNAGVSVVITGIRNQEKRNKFIYNEKGVRTVLNINPYLIEGRDVIIKRSSNPISRFPDMIKGSIPADGGNLLLDEKEVGPYLENRLLSNFIKEFIGAQEILKGFKRYCIYLTDEDYESLKNNLIVSERFDKVKQMRLDSSKKATRELAKFPNRFAEDRYYEASSLIIPAVTSENRDYIPIAFLEAGPVVYASAHAIYNPPPFIFGVLNSRMHNVWVKTVAGKLESRLRYSSSICYNAYPFPSISETFNSEIEQCTFRILEEREKNSDKTLVELYDPEKMPTGLRDAHRANDEVIERCYRSRPFESDEDRLEHLFKLYEEMIEEEKNRETLFASQSKKRRR